MEPFYKSTHRLSEVDPANKQAICSVCGPVGIHSRPDANRKVPWRCASYAKAAALRKYYSLPAPERVRAWTESSIRPRKALLIQENRRIYRELVIKGLGGKCANPECRWANEDGSYGCMDIRCLQVDHVNGDGYREVINYSSRRHVDRIMRNADGRYQLLCCNCNWLKRIDKEEGRRHVVHKIEHLTRTLEGPAYA